MEKRSAAPVKMMPAHRVKLMSEGNTNEEFRDDATKTMALTADNAETHSKGRPTSLAYSDSRLIRPRILARRVAAVNG